MLRIFAQLYPLLSAHTHTHVHTHYILYRHTQTGVIAYNPRSGDERLCEEVIYGTSRRCRAEGIYEEKKAKTEYIITHNVLSLSLSFS